MSLLLLKKRGFVRGGLVAYYDCSPCGARLISSPAACIITHGDGTSDVFSAEHNPCPGEGPDQEDNHGR